MGCIKIVSSINNQNYFVGTNNKPPAKIWFRFFKVNSLLWIHRLGEEPEARF